MSPNDTRAQIVDAALRLFEMRGYDGTTMRAVAAEAGVSVGNAYYYFSSKEELVHGFYDRIAELHADATRDVIAAEAAFGARLRGVMLAWIEVAAPFHEFGRQFFVNAADPHSPLSPFSAQSASARDAAIELLARVVDGSDVRVAAELRDELPRLLWLYQMGIVLFWIHDRSHGQARTRMLVERTVPLVARTVGLSRMRLLRPVSREVVSLIQDLVEPASR